MNARINQNVVRIINLPWLLNRQNLVEFFINHLNIKPRSANVLYNKDTGLSRGIAFVETSESNVNELLKQGYFRIDGREVKVVRAHRWNRNTR